MAVNVFTNYLNEVAKTPIDFPIVADLGPSTVSSRGR